jgi:hypothetical protein
MLTRNVNKNVYSSVNNPFTAMSASTNIYFRCFVNLAGKNILPYKPMFFECGARSQMFIMHIVQLGSDKVRIVNTEFHIIVTDIAIHK